ncbi:MAG: sugar phosphate isomerase/epimerase [Acidobacteria bacterium]|nr:sugar phosphate isomerase/epimerase [Acidobacteriota bacterium]
MVSSRREFLAAGAAFSQAQAAPPRDVISLAAWSLNRSFFLYQRWKNLDLPRICREQFGISALEFVNQFFENPTLRYLQDLKKQGANNGVTFVRIMVDSEGDMAAVDRKERMQSAVAHRKWVDIAHDLGCKDIRCNMRGGPADWKQDKDLISRAAESFRDLLEYAKGSGLDIIIENHGGASSDPDVLAALMKAVNDPRFGTLPDFGNVNAGDDHAVVLRKLLPWAKGVSVKASWAEDGSHPAFDIGKLLRICLDQGFHGYWGIESSFGRRRRGEPEVKLSADQVWQNEVRGILLTKALIEKVVLRKS